MLTALVTCVPLLGKVPLHPSPAVHEAALVESQVKVDVLPGATTDGYTLKVAVGITLTVVLALEVPPGPEQDSEYTAAEDNGPVLWVPLTPKAPFHAPDAVQEVALVEVHCKLAALPVATAAGEAVKVTTGSGRMETVTLAGDETPRDRRSSENRLRPSLKVLCFACRWQSASLQAPDALHEAAPAEFHDRTAA